MSTTTESRKTGYVKFFNSVKGYGFIIPNDQEEGSEVFVHHSAIHNNGGFKSLCQGEEVAFDIIKSDKGLQATNVTSVEGGPVKGDPRAGKKMLYQQYYPPYDGNQYVRPSQFNPGYSMDPYTNPPQGFNFPMGNNFMGYNSQVPQGYPYYRPPSTQGGSNNGVNPNHHHQQQPMSYQSYNMPNTHVQQPPLHFGLSSSPTSNHQPS
ncbi:unnamed protein product [Cunninghamella blakesleeana]